MRKVLISIAAAGTALAYATPASAQIFPAPQAQGYGYGYGYNNRGQMRVLQSRIDRIQNEIRMLHSRRMLSRNEYNALRSDSRSLEQRLRQASRNGLNQSEMRNVEYRIARLEQKVRREVADGNRWRQGQYGQNTSYNDRDRDGRDDRYEDDRGRDRDD